MAEDRAPNGKSGEKHAGPGHQLLRGARERVQRLDGGREGWQDHPHPPDALRLEVRPREAHEPLEDGSAGEHVRAEHEDAHPAVFHRLQEAGLLAGPRPLPHEEGGLGPATASATRRTAARASTCASPGTRLSTPSSAR